MMILDPLFLGNAALFAAVFASGALDLGDVFGSEDGDEEDEADAVVGPPVVPPTDPVLGTEGDDDVTAAVDGPGLFDLLGGNDTLDASVFNDTVDAGAGDDEIFGRTGNDLITLGEGNDRGFGGFGSDTISGGMGSDEVAGGSGDDSLTGGDGDDLVSGGKDSDTLSGDAGDDVLNGGEGRDILLGGAGNDTLNGTYDDSTRSRTLANDLDDTLAGGAGDDTLILGSDDRGIGGAGADRFIVDDFVVEQGRDSTADLTPAVIEDFDPDFDTLSIEFDPEAGDGLLEIASFEGRSGVSLIVDGIEVAVVTGAPDLTTDQVQLVAI